MPVLIDLEIKIFLDCNSSLNLQEAQYLFHKLEPFKNQIGAIEDPVAWHEIHWKFLKEQFSIPLALDRVYQENFNKFRLNSNCIDYLTIKPAYEKVPPNFIKETNYPQYV